MKILITGSTGFIGKNLVEFYSPDNELVIPTRWDHITKALNESKPDLVLHCAAEIYNEALMFHANVELTKNILEWVKKNPETKIIYFGSSSEYGNMDRASNEKDPINPINLYQATKGMGTLLCQGYARKYDLDVKIARVYSAYGNHEKAHRLFPTLYRGFYKNESLTIYQGQHDFIYIKDFIRGIDLLEKSKKDPGHIVNFGSGCQTSNFELINIWKKVTGLNPEIVFKEEVMNSRTENSVWLCDFAHAKASIGFVTEYSLEEGISDFIGIQNASN